MEARDTFIDAISAILASKGYISSSERTAIADNFSQSDHDSFINFLKEEGIVDSENLLDTLSTYYQVPSFDVVGQFFDHEYLHKFPKGFLLRNGIIPLERDENILIMIAHEPDDPELLPKIGSYVSYDIQFYVGLEVEICDAIKEFYDRALSEVNDEGDSLPEDPDRTGFDFPDQD
jgi:hypothetical protein